jgi:hypothetical protein
MGIRQESICLNFIHPKNREYLLMMNMKIKGYSGGDRTEFVQHKIRAIAASVLGQF